MKSHCRPVEAIAWACSITLIVLLSGILFIQPGRAAEDQPVRLDCTPKAFPALTIRGEDVSRDPDNKPAAFRGLADPCLRRDPVTGELWLAYSWPHVEYLKGSWRDVAVGVETHLASSRDGGQTWQRSKVLWPRNPAKFTDLQTNARRDGFLSHEVPNIVPCVIDGKTMWVGARLDYFLGREGNYKARDNRSFCMRLMAAPSPPALSDAPYITFGHDLSTRECAVDLNVCDFSDDFPPIFIPNEPALFFKDGRLYFAFVCMTFYGQTPDFAKSFIAVFSSEPRGDIKTWKWRYHGKLAAHKEARELGGEALTQVEFALSRDGRLLALLTSEAWDAQAAAEFGDTFGGIMHTGCAVVEVASLDNPGLVRRPDGKLAVRAFLYSSVQSRQGPGAAGYDPASATGILFTLRDLTVKENLVWSLHPTGLHP